MLLGMYLLCEVQRSKNESVMETEKKHQPLLKVTEILLKNCMHSYSAHSNSAVKGGTVLKVYRFIIRK